MAMLRYQYIPNLDNLYRSNMRRMFLNTVLSCLEWVWPLEYFPNLCDLHSLLCEGNEYESYIT